MPDTTKGLRGLTFESAISPDPHINNRLDITRRTGEPVYEKYYNEPATRFRQFMKVYGDEDALLRSMLDWNPSQNQEIMAQRQGFLSSSPEENIGLAAAAMGYGSSRFDSRLTHPAQLNDLEDARAREQSTLGVLGNSLMKMGTLAATTAADSWVGLPAGLINVIAETVKGNIHSGSDAFNAIVANPVSARLQEINEKSDDIFRNYRTAEERNRPWWENIFTSNFIGDTLIKNAGFTIGAVIGARVAVGELSELTGIREARDAFKGLSAELGLSGKTSGEVVKMLSQGATDLEKRAAVNALAQSARNLRNAELGLQIAGGLVAGSGEARIEALNAVSELDKTYEQLYGDLDLEYMKALSRLEHDMMVRGLSTRRADGNIVFDRKYFEEQKKKIDDHYNRLREQIAHDRATVANTVFALNVPLLTAGDMVQWGKLMLGGYAIDRNLVKGITKATEKSAIRSAAKTPAELMRATRYAVKGGKTSEFFGKALAGSRNVFVEMQEEMNQSWISSAAKAKAMGSTTEFMERLYDPRAVVDTVSWLDAAKEGLRQSWLNKDDWVEGFAGGFMGFLGLPSISVRTNENGESKPKLTMEGGIWSPIREKSEMYKRREELVKTLNNRLSEPEFLNYYYGEIGRRHFDLMKEKSVEEGDEYLYDKADHAQLINDAIMFSNAGRLQDLVDIVDSFENASDETLNQIKSLFPNSEDVQKMLPDVMRDHINKSAERMKYQLNQFIKIADDIKTVYGNNTSDKQLAEMTWQTVRLDYVEKAMKDILNDPDMSAFISAFRAEQSERTKDLSNHEIVSSDIFAKWLSNKKEDVKDTDDKGKVDAAIKNAEKAKRYWDDRIGYINNLSDLSNDPSLVEGKMKRRAELLEKQRQMNRYIQAAAILSTTDKLSEFVSVMEEFGKVDDVVLEEIKRQADNGNKIADEYLKVRNIDAVIEENIRKAGGESATEDQIQQALKAWKYFKLNSDTAFDLINDHAASDIAPEIAGAEAVALLNRAIKEADKELKFFDTIKKRTVKKDNGKKNRDDRSGEGAVGGNSTKFKTTGKKLTEDTWNEIVNHIRGLRNDNTNNVIIRVDLGMGDVYYGDEPADGYVYFYFRDGKISKPVAYDQNGNEIDPSEIEKLHGPDGQDFITWVMRDDDFPVAAKRPFAVIFPKVEQASKKSMPIVKKTKAPKSISGQTIEAGNNPGSKTNPHKFIVPNMDAALLGGDGHAVAEVLKSLSDGDDIHFGIEREDGPIYLLAGDSNSKIGTLPKEVEGSDYYSGLAELESLIRKEFSESSDRRNADGMWISEKYVNHVREKHNAGFEATDENVSLSKIPNFEKVKEPILMYVYDKGGEQQRLFSSPNVTYDQVARQYSRQSSDVLTPGFVYLLVPSGEKYIPVFLYTQNVNSNTLDLRNPEVISKGFGKRLSDTIDKVVDAVTKKQGAERKAAFEKWALNIGKSGYGKLSSSPDSLQHLLYFNSSGKKQVQFYVKETCHQHPEWFTDNVVMVINVHDNETKEDDYETIEVGQSKSVRDQIIDVFDKLKYTTESGRENTGPLANVRTVHFAEDKANLPARIREFIESDMFLANVKDFDLEMPSYIMDYWSVSDGKFIRPSHAPAKKPGTGNKVVQKNTKGKGTEKIATVNISGTNVQYNLTSGKVKIGDGKWFSKFDATDKEAKAVKKLGFKKGDDFLRTAKALAIIADKYGDNENGEWKRGSRVVLKRFNGNADAGFILTENGGKFMTKDELVKFKAELKVAKGSAEAANVAAERARLNKERQAGNIPKGDTGSQAPETNTDYIDDDMVDQEIEPSSPSRSQEIETLESVSNVRQAIELLKKNAPQYAKFLDYISGITYYDDVLVEFANTVDPRNKRSAGRNVIRYRGNEFTDRIIIGRNSLGYQTMMHELVHAFTTVALKYDNNLRENVQTAMDYLYDSIGTAKLSSTLGVDGMYAFRNPNEFVAEFFSNPRLQKLAKEVQMPSTVTEKTPGNVFSRIINYIANAIKSLFRRGDKSFYDKLNDTLYSIVDRQVELQEEGKMIFKTKEEFDKAKSLASGAKVNGVAFATKIPTVEENYDYQYVQTPFGDEAFVPSPGQFYGPNKFLTISQLVAANDEFSSLSGMKRFVNSSNLYSYNSGTISSIVGVRDEASDVFVGVRAYPAGGTDYSALIRTAAESEVPMIIGSTKDNVDFYKAFGFHAVHETAVNDKIFMANDAFTDEHLYRLGTTYRPFADVLDDNSRFTELRRQTYSDAEWNKFSELEKYHARKCIGI